MAEFYGKHVEYNGQELGVITLSRSKKIRYYEITIGCFKKIAGKDRKESFIRDIDGLLKCVTHQLKYWDIHTSPIPGPCEDNGEMKGLLNTKKLTQNILSALNGTNQNSL